MTDKPPTLVPVEERIIQFYDDELVAVRLEDGSIYIPMRRICSNLGLTWSSQWERIRRDRVLSEATDRVLVTRTQSDKTRGLERQEMVCLPLKFVPGWLFGVNASRVREEIREKLIRYRRECFDVLWDAFKGEILPAVDPALTPPAESMSPAEHALATIEALHTLAKQQVVMERWLSVHDARLDVAEEYLEMVDGRLDKAAQVVGGHARRLQRIELTLAGGATVTDAQAAAISEAVKALAFELGKKESEKGNPYQRVYAELYRKFKVPSYRALLLESFPAVMAWLVEWWQQVTADPPPFGSGDVGG